MPKRQKKAVRYVSRRHFQVIRTNRVAGLYELTDAPNVGIFLSEYPFLNGLLLEAYPNNGTLVGDGFQREPRDH